MRYYPINLEINNRDCLVVGGGQVGTRKVMGLLKCGATVSVVSPEATKKIIQLMTQKKITWHRRTYQTSDMQNRFLVIGATDNEALNRRIHNDAQSHKVLCNIADRPEICNFILPAVVQRGDLVIAVSTSGKSPAFAKRLRKELQQTYGEEYERFLELMGVIRTRLLNGAHEPEAHKPLFEALIEGGLVTAIKANDIKTIDKLLKSVLGESFTYDNLMREE
jgi:precorrin-2 dehydrogenase/sirohydrochlorin ferrochelatase